MAAALTPPFALAAIVLCVAGVAKLRAPGSAAEAVGAPTIAVRAFAMGELALGAWALATPGPIPAATVASVYAGFAVLGLVLARRHAPCGCFGERDQPASAVQSGLSVLLAATAALSAHWSPRSLTWLIERSPVALIGLAGAAYAAVLAYTVLPAAWSAWESSPR
jgi:hypothetical protein